MENISYGGGKEALLVSTAKIKTMKNKSGLIVPEGLDWLWRPGF